MDVSIVGTGYVGLVTGTCLAAVGHRVACIDVLEDRVARINAGLAPFFEPGLDDLVATATQSRSLSATTDLAMAVHASAVTMIAVGTPDHEGRIDLSQITAAARSVGSALKTKPGYHVVAVKSTVVPGTTAGVVKAALEEGSGKQAGADFGLCMNPEFLREGTAIDDFMTPDRVVIGALDERSGRIFGELYRSFDCPKMMVSLDNAEFIKYASNSLLATLVSFSNELAALCEATPGTDVEVVMDGLHLDKRLSPIVNGERVRPGILSYIRPSSGYGGSCLPKDIAALRAFAREKQVATPVLDAVAAVNERRARAVLDLAEERAGKFEGRDIAVLGLAFKAGTDDLRHSPAILLVEGLLDRGARVSVYDPVATALAKPIFDDRVTYATSAAAALTGSDMAIIGTGWPEWHELDWSEAQLKMRGAVIFDARNSLRSLDLPDTFTRYQIGLGTSL